MSIEEELRARIEAYPASYSSEARKLDRAILDELSRLREVERGAKEVIRPFALLVERQDASDLAFLKEQGGGEKDMVHYAPDSAKVHSSGELRGALYLTKGDFRDLAKFYRALSEREGQE